MGEAATLRGRMTHIASTLPGRTGRATLHALGAVADGLAFGWSEELDHNFYGRTIRCWEHGGTNTASFHSEVRDPELGQALPLNIGMARCFVYCVLL